MIPASYLFKDLYRRRFVEADAVPERPRRPASAPTQPTRR